MRCIGRCRWRREARILVAGTFLAMIAGHLLVPGGAVADVVVTKGGDSVQTRGPWKVDGGLVVFERPDGTLASMRLSEVDLEASERATEEAKAAAERARTASEEDDGAEEDEPRREPVARLTDRDLPPVGRITDAEGKGSSDAESDTSSGPPGRTAGAEDEAGGLEIVEWAEDEGFGEEGLRFVGRIHNASDHTAVGIRVTGTLLDEEGQERGSTTAILTSDALRAGQSADFRADFPGTFSYADVEFAVDGDLLLDEPPPGAEEEVGASSGEEPESAEEQGSEGA